MIQRFDKSLDLLSLYGVMFCIFSMLILALASISLRQFNITFLWIDPLVRHLVFLATFLGGSLAVGKNQHIKIDLISRMLEHSDKRILKKSISIINLLATAFASGILIISSYKLMFLEFEDETYAFLGIHMGYLIGIITVGMTLIIMRLLLRILIELFEGDC